MKNQIEIVNVLLTQRCNLNCSYCDLVKDYPKKPEKYPDMKYYSKNEISGNDWIKIFQKILENNINSFFIIYGGEPFVYNDLSIIIKWFQNKNVNHTIISNNTDGIQHRIKKVLDDIGGKFTGFTSSVDPLIFDGNADKTTDRYKKSYAGFTRLVEMKKNNIAKDVVAEITTDKENIHLLYKTVKELSKNKIYSSITCIDDKKNSYYDFASKPDSDMLLYKKDVEDEFNKCMNDKNLLIHIPELLNKLKNNLPSNMSCNIYNDIHNITISPDGKLRLCLRIRGVDVPRIDNWINIDGILSPWLSSAMLNDYIRYCEGCNWTCILMSEYFSDDVLDH